uniref:Uncharacterized protein n=1 Tax=Arundo donax TaxID=35708 RepID=A0A0A8ZEF6_ARUDO
MYHQRALEKENREQVWNLQESIYMFQLHVFFFLRSKDKVRKEV